MKNLFLYLLLPLLTLTLAACSSDDDEYPITPTQPEEVEVIPSGKKASAAYRLEVPARDENNLFVSHWTVENGDSVMSYCFEFNKQKYHTRWVAFRFDRITRQKNIGRTNAWADDPDLPSAYQIGTDYFNGYQRGHICASADRLYSTAANNTTFYMSNMSPQIGNFNEGVWLNLENLVQALGHDASFADTLYVVKGGTIEDDQIKAYVNRSKGIKMAVPQYYFVALLKENVGISGSTYAGIAFLLEHRKYGDNEISSLENFACSIDELEEFTGIDFFPRLPEKVQNVVESGFTYSVWDR